MTGILIMASQLSMFGLVKYYALMIRHAPIVCTLVIFTAVNIGAPINAPLLITTYNYC